IAPSTSIDVGLVAVAEPETGDEGGEAPIPGHEVIVAGSARDVEGATGFDLYQIDGEIEVRAEDESCQSILVGPAGLEEKHTESRCDPETHATPQTPFEADTRGQDIVLRSDGCAADLEAETGADGRVRSVAADLDFRGGSV